MPSRLTERYEELKQFAESADLNHATARLQDFARDFRAGDALFARATAIRQKFNLQKTAEGAHTAALREETRRETMACANEILAEAERNPPPFSLTQLICVTDQLQKSYKRGKGFQLHPTNISLSFGEILAVVGENGNGKTTLLRMLAGDLAPTSGGVSYPYLKRPDDTGNARKFEEIQGKVGNDGFEYSNAASGMTYYAIKQRIAYVPQALPRWSGRVKENLLFVGAAHGLAARNVAAEVDFIISRLGLDAYREAEWNELSGGYRMRFALARALIPVPNLLVLDEPLANLDVNTQLMFLQDLRNLTDSLARPLAIAVSSQHLHEIESIANRVLFLKEGRTVYSGLRSEFGAKRTENVFEFNCTLTREQLAAALAHIPSCRIEIVGANFMAYTPIETTAQEFLQLLLNQHAQIEYFRDISQSTRKLFQKEG